MQPIPACPASSCIGVDVSSKELRIAAASETALNTPVASLSNTPAPIKRWLKSLPPGCRIGMEATGCYHRTLADLAVAAGHTVFVFNPAHIATYLRSLRSRGKTDVLDARGIARYVLNESAACHHYVPPTALQSQLALLIQRRHQVVKQRASLRMSLKDVKTCATPVKTVLLAFDRLIAAIDKQLDQALAGDPKLQAQRQQLRSIHGFGPLVSAAFAARLSRVPYANSDALVAAIGMDPRPRDSGEYAGQRHLSKCGNAEERRLIYLAAVSACRNPVFRAMRDKLLARGLSKIAAYCVIARKLLRIALAVWKSEQPFNLQLVGRG